MWKSKNETTRTKSYGKGYTLIEVVVSMSILTLIIFSALSMQYNKNKLKILNERLDNGIKCMELIKNSIYFRSSYNEVKALQTETSWYINSIDFQTLKENNIINIIEQKCTNSNHIKIEVKGEEVLEICMEMNLNIQGKVKVISERLYKGRY